MPNRICKTCKKEFYVKPSYIKLGRGKHCSRKCRIKKIKMVCAICKKQIFLKPSLISYRKCCSKKCGNIYKSKHFRHTKRWKKTMRERFSGRKNPRWKGGFFDRHGYRYLHKPTHPFCSSTGYVFEHRLVMEAMLGRYLHKGEIVHHKNGKKKDNRPQNLLLLTRKQHSKIRSIGINTCPKCNFRWGKKH